MVGLRGWVIVWCRRCSISPIITSTDWDIYCHASSLSVLCIRGHLSPLHEASRRSGMLWSPFITWVHSQYCTIIYHIKKLVGINIIWMYIMPLSCKWYNIKAILSREKCVATFFGPLFIYILDVKVKLIFNNHKNLSIQKFFHIIVLKYY